MRGFGLVLAGLLRLVTLVAALATLALGWRCARRHLVRLREGVG